ncbi:hypothetical protein LV476_01190 [Guyparkeria hydrothermalis]|uniref:hypothetical protein n=1 Tax=Guyparkeria hydrothermalis TaxID=923 RepID=UPI002020324E|nr:hypothetical protein [Guyparkeria hydrothermalis]MCL7743565.1 hypothetical protein [Guyparkeria hydrothermalis]
MPIPSPKALATLASSVSLAACMTSSAVADNTFGELNGVLASGAPVVFVPVGTNDRGCTMYTKKPLRDGILVDTGIWYRTAHDQFVLDADRCVPDHLAPKRED